MRKGQPLTLLDGSGGVGEASISEIAPTYTVVNIESVRQVEEQRSRLHLYQALPRGAKMDHVVQWSVELGAAHVIPFSCARSRDVDAAVEKRIDRWRKIAVESSRVAGRPFLPFIREALRWREALESLQELDAVLYADEQGGQRPDEALSGTAAGDLGLMIGPEGGFTDAERDELKSLGSAVTLGEIVLRTETAGLVLMAAVRCHYELL
jgi:16S rRNA (uracil1498-N3)-methyltransferase